jgi:hypothetical protein
MHYLESPDPRVLSIIPAQNDELWTRAKRLYKVGSVVADGGEAVPYAPHIREMSVTHPPDRHHSAATAGSTS